MKVCIGSQGRFHMFDLARQMERLGHLEQLYTGYPRSKINNLPAGKVSTFPWLMSTYMAAGRLGLGKLVKQMSFRINTSFDKWVARNLGECDVYHCLSGSGTRTHQIARERYGALTVCDRGSTHVLYQRKLMNEEFERQGLPFPNPDPGLIERELVEYEYCDLIFVPTKHTYRTFIEYGVPPHKLRINPYGAEIDAFHPVPKADHVFRVIYVGALSVRKGIGYLLDAFAGLRLQNFELWLIGPQFPEVKRALSRHEGEFKYLGIIDRSELHRYYSQGSVFVMPSIEEGLALVQGQAMACGLPVIATTNTGAEDLFTDGVEGFIVPIRDPEAIRDKVFLLYHDPELRDAMSRAALRRVRAMGGWDEYGHRAERIYAHGLASRGTNQDANTVA
jgi:starch synthase